MKTGTLNSNLWCIIMPIFIFIVLFYLYTYGPGPVSSSNTQILKYDGVTTSLTSQDPAPQYHTKSETMKTPVNELVFDCPVDTEDGKEDNIALYGKPVYESMRKVLFISMPKCGTRSFVWIVDKIIASRHCGARVNVDYMLAGTSEYAIKTLGEKLRMAEDGTVIHGHYRYVSTDNLPENPVYLSMLRDPLSRFESHFYFMRHGDDDISKEQLILKLGKASALPNETLDDCVEHKRIECSSPQNIRQNPYITSFCGHAPQCNSDPDYALKQAKKNVDKFLVIGITEDYDLTMAVFEKLLPSTFKGARQAYTETKEESMAKSKTSHKKPPSPNTYSILRERLRYDYEFYNYVKDRFHRLAERMGVGRCQTVKHDD